MLYVTVGFTRDLAQYRAHYPRWKYGESRANCRRQSGLVHLSGNLDQLLRCNEPVNPALQQRNHRERYRNRAMSVRMDQILLRDP